MLLTERNCRHDGWFLWHLPPYGGSSVRRVPMPIQSPQELLVHELHDIEDAETQAAQALQKHMKEVQNDELREMLEERLKQGETLLEDVRQCLQKLNGKSKGTRNSAARGLIEEAEKLAKEVKSPEMKQAVIIAGAQKLEHYCIAAWGTVKAIANEVGQQELGEIMQRAVDEGYRWDEEMTRIAESRINPEAIESSVRSGKSQSSGKSSSRGDGQSEKRSR
ncbi:ferritin-like domain-containing protein [Chelatococcus sp. GCM10030263]|uniref:YciE/YciF ferroxidase family protein n=1 Tax=Chelatococcus sp. GCM10030263 TaxID=3273387 RepID=UPI00360911DF